MTALEIAALLMMPAAGLIFAGIALYATRSERRKR